MGLQLAPAWIAQNIDSTDFQHPIELGRQMLASSYGRRSGLIQYGDLAVSTPGSGLTVNIAAGAAYLQGAESDLQGGYFAWLNDADSVNFGAPSASARYDTILLRVEDQQYGSIPADPGAYFDVVQGAVGGGAPRADSYFNFGGGAYVPGAWFRVADVLINPGDSSVASNHITQNNTYVAGPGGEILCSSTNRPAGVFGRSIYETDTGLAWRYDTGLSAYVMRNPYHKIQSLSVAGPTITFSSIPSNLKYIRIVFSARSTVAAQFDRINFLVNGDTTGVYSNFTSWIQNGGTSLGSNNTATNTMGEIGYCAGASLTAGRFSSGWCEFTDWDVPSGRTNYLNYLSGAGFFETTGLSLQSHTVGNYRGSAASGYTSLTLKTVSGSNFLAGSRAEIFGWA